jgi:hypothetical protein
MERSTFPQRVRQIDARVREIDPALTDTVRFILEEATASWERDEYRAILVLHSGEEPVRLSLELLTGSAKHPDSEQIGIDDADVVELVARPIAMLLSGAVTE